jgi:hypothetical protein
MTAPAAEVQAGYWPAVAMAEEAIEDARGHWRSGDHLAALADLECLLVDLREALELAEAAFYTAEAEADLDQ